MSGDTIVVGGGVVGVCVAHSLAERGVRVALVERGEIGSGASHGNAGWIFPSHSTPLPVPGAVRQGLRWLFDPESPLYIRPRVDLELARWLWRFRAACTAAAVRRTFALNRELSLASRDLYAEFARRLDFGYAQRGLLVACSTYESLHEAEAELDLLRAFGGEAEVLDASALRERAPALSKDLAGGVYLPADAHIAPAKFVHALAADLEARGVSVHRQCEVLEITPAAAGGARLQTTRGELECDELVLAAGAWTPALARAYDLRVPVQPAKGYSVTKRRPDGFGDTPIMLSEAKVGVTPMGDRLRFAGTLELAGLDLSVDLRRLRAVERAFARYLPDLPETEHLETWRGLRPLTPDDLPILGRPPGTRGLVLATGHGMSGMSQGPITGELVAELVCGEAPSFDLLPFSPERFGR